MSRLRPLDPWLWPPLLMAVIFILSAQPNLSTGLGWIDLVGRKFVHAALYAALCAAWWRALATRTPLRPAVAMALVITLAYALSDEYHQAFVTGRHGSPVDVLIDAAGATLAATLRLRATPAPKRAREPS